MKTMTKTGTLLVGLVLSTLSSYAIAEEVSCSFTYYADDTCSKCCGTENVSACVHLKKCVDPAIEQRRKAHEIEKLRLQRDILKERLKLEEQKASKD